MNRWGRKPTTTVWENGATAAAYDGSAGTQPPPTRGTMSVRQSKADLRRTTPIWESSQALTKKTLHLSNPVATLRPERGNAVAKHDGSAGQIRKPLRPQFRTNYDDKKGRNKVRLLVGPEKPRFSCDTHQAKVILPSLLDHQVMVLS